MTEFAAPADAPHDNWVDRFAPPFAKPYLRLMRADRPIGAWLLLLPCWWGLTLALAESGGKAEMFIFAVLFAIGAVMMRGAGCAYNDIIDRHFDARVARTAQRPIPSGQISVRNATIFLGILCAGGLTTLLQFNSFTILLGLGSLALVAAYPFMKRITWWPQAWLGLTFNWGALMGYAAITGNLSVASLLIYAAGVAWTLGYDTIYAHQDKDDDALIGVKSSARALGAKTRPALMVFYAFTIALTAGAGYAASLPSWYFAALLAPTTHFVWQIRSIEIDDPARCLAVFKSNRDAGLLILAALLLAAAMEHL